MAVKGVMVTSGNHYPVVIVGAGMVGASLACALHDADIGCMLIEAGELMPKPLAPEPLIPQPRPPIGPPIATSSSEGSSVGEQQDAKVSALNQASQNLLTHLGAWETILASSRLQPYTAMRVWDAAGTGQLDFTARAQHAPYLGHIIENRIILGALHQQVRQRGIPVLTHTHITDTGTQTQQPRRLTLSDASCISTDLLVGADGGQSKIRHMAGLPTQEWDYPHQAIVTRITLNQHHQNTAWQRFTPTGVLAFLPLFDSPDTLNGQSHCSIVWSVKHDLANRYMALPTSDFLPSFD